VAARCGAAFGVAYRRDALCSAALQSGVMVAATLCTERAVARGSPDCRNAPPKAGPLNACSVTIKKIF
jgi:hypothetical protein